MRIPRAERRMARRRDNLSVSVCEKIVSLESVSGRGLHGSEHIWLYSWQRFARCPHVDARDTEPGITSAKAGGNKRIANLREVINRMLYLLTPGSRWRAIPGILSPEGTIQGDLDRYSEDARPDRLQGRYLKWREQMGRQAARWP